MSGLFQSWLSNSIPERFTWSFKETDLVPSSSLPPVDLQLRTKIQALNQIKELCETNSQILPKELSSKITDFTQKIVNLQKRRKDATDIPLLTGLTVGCLILSTMLRIDLVAKLVVITGGVFSGAFLAVGLCVAAGTAVGIAAKYFEKRALAKEEASIDLLASNITTLLTQNKNLFGSASFTLDQDANDLINELR